MTPSPVQLDLEVQPVAADAAWPDGGRDVRHLSFSYPVPPARWTAAHLRAVMAQAAQLVPAALPVSTVHYVSWADDGGFELGLQVGEAGEFAATLRAGASPEADAEDQPDGGMRWLLMCGPQEPSLFEIGR